MIKKSRNDDCLRVYQWRSKEILLIKMNDGNAQTHYRVLGWVAGEPAPNGKYTTTPILKKDQRHCRAYLRGTNIPVTSKISFLEDI